MLTKALNSLIKRTKTVKEIEKTIQILSRQIQDNTSIFEIGEHSRMYLPNALEDYIQRTIAGTGKFYEETILKKIDPYIPENAIILDIGSNIGNHSIYWATIRNAKKIYAFEPVKNTFEILQKNIEINHLTKIVTAFNVGLSAKKSKGSIQNFNKKNIGGTKLLEGKNGDLELISIDSLNLQNKKIDFVKIDTEGFEIKVLQGAINTLKKDKPTIFIEIFKENKKQVHMLLTQIGYKKTKSLPDYNYIYQYRP